MPDGDVVELLAMSHKGSGGLDDQKAIMTAPTSAPRTNTLALIGFIAAFVIPVAGFILGVFALRQLRAPGNTESGAGLARWALVIGAVLTVFSVLFFVLWASLFFSALNGQPFGR
ncbi:hypothetical protein [Microbacterium sp.]|jgi:hypothetical protein|uniref:hypothetical protein n=1 Tax=Microbacterium sp. TaxID=51671 RepID=UPI00262C0FAF|nr:hypothetical protein [Microbacterium sp.]